MEITNLETRLLSLKNKIEDKKKERERLFGKLETYKEELKTLGFSDIESAEKGLDELKEEKEKLTQQLEEEIVKAEAILNEK